MLTVLGSYHRLAPSAALVGGVDNSEMTASLRAHSRHYRPVWQNGEGGLVKVPAHERRLAPALTTVSRPEHVALVAALVEKLEIDGHQHGPVLQLDDLAEGRNRAAAGVEVVDGRATLGLRPS